MRVVSRRIGWIGESLLPRLEFAGSIERDDEKKVFSGARNPRFRDKTTPLQCLRFVVEEVNDVVEYLWRKTRQHRGFSRGTIG